MIAACSQHPTLPTATGTEAANVAKSEYLVGPGDNLNVFVWRNPELSITIPVRPDGRISIPLVDDTVAAGKTPTQLARDLEVKLRPFVKDPIVTVIPMSFVGVFTEQIRIIGEAAQPHAVPYRENMTLLDVMIEVGGLTKYAAGNQAVIVRTAANGEMKTFGVHLDDLIRDGDIQANVYMQPGDILTIPQSYF